MNNIIKSLYIEYLKKNCIIESCCKSRDNEYIIVMYHVPKCYANEVKPNNYKFIRKYRIGPDKLDLIIGYEKDGLRHVSRVLDATDVARWLGYKFV